MRLTVGVMGFYAHSWGAGDPPSLNWPRLVALGWSDALGPGAAVSHVTATLDNGDGALTAWFQTPPLGSVAVVADEAGRVLLDGVVTRVSLGGLVVIVVEA